jgi:hypothetical protein
MRVAITLLGFGQQLSLRQTVAARKLPVDVVGLLGDAGTG